MPSAAEVQKRLIGELDDLREIRGKGVREFCKAANVGTSTWYDYASLKTSPPLDDLCRMAEALQSQLSIAVRRNEDAEGNMTKLGSLESREVLLLMEKMTPDQRAYVRDLARAVALPRSPARR